MEGLEEKVVGLVRAGLIAESALDECAELRLGEARALRMHSLADSMNGTDRALSGLYGAITQLDKGLELKPDFIEAYVERGEIWRILEDPLRTDSDFTMAFNLLMQMPPTDFPQYIRDATLLTRIGHREKAAEYAKNARDFATRPEEFYEVAMLKISYGDLAGAAKDMEIAKAASPTNALYFIGSSKINFLRGNYEKALADAEAAVKLQPDEPYSYYARADAKAALGDLPGSNADKSHGTDLLQAQNALKVEKLDALVAGAKGILDLS